MTVICWVLLQFYVVINIKQASLADEQILYFSLILSLISNTYAGAMMLFPKTFKEVTPVFYAVVVIWLSKQPFHREATRGIKKDSRVTTNPPSLPDHTKVFRNWYVIINLTKKLEFFHFLTHFLKRGVEWYHGCGSVSSSSWPHFKIGNSQNLKTVVFHIFHAPIKSPARCQKTFSKILVTSLICSIERSMYGLSHARSIGVEVDHFSIIKFALNSLDEQLFHG